MQRGGKYINCETVDSARELDCATIQEIVYNVTQSLWSGPKNTTHARHTPTHSTTKLVQNAVFNYHRFLQTEDAINYMLSAYHYSEDHEVLRDCKSVIKNMITAAMMVTIETYPELRENGVLLIVEELTEELYSMFVRRHVLFKQLARERPRYSFTAVS
jgi:hypothetical protein